MLDIKNDEAELQNEIAPKDDLPKRPSVWAWLNVLYVVLSLLGGMIWCAGTMGILFGLLPFQFISSVALAIIYKIYVHKKGKKLKIALYITRTAAIAITAVIILSPLAIMKFKNAPNAYHLKRIVYTYGVGNTERCRQIFPKSLPDNCEDYIFVTQSSIGGLQDYYPTGYLIYHTDSDTLRKYEEHISSLGIAERFENTPKDPKDYYDEDDNDEYKEMMYIQMNCPDKLPGHVYSRFCNEISDNLSDAVVYIVNDNLSRGCMFNYETGLAVFWV